MSIGIRCGRIWGISKRILIKALGEFYTENNPTIVFDTMKPKNRVIIDKILMNRKLDEFGIPHPKTYYHPFNNLPNKRRRCIVKNRFGSGGNHLIFTTFRRINKNDLNDKYVQEYIPFDKEYRVGIFKQEVLGIREKIGKDKIKNSKTCRYETRDMPNLVEFSLYISAQFGVDFTGIDIGLWKGKFIVIELNSSPTIGEYWARKIAEKLINNYMDMI